MGRKAGLDDVERRKMLPCRDWNLGRLANSQSQYRLSYPDFSFQ
jgi:hypothetical protein